LQDRAAILRLPSKGSACGAERPQVFFFFFFFFFSTGICSFEACR
jgi:hypothetical protein